MSNNQELVMETTHGRSKKCKTEFKAVLNKVLVSGLVLATMLGTATPAFAAEMPKDNLNAYATSVAYSQGISVESAISDIRNTISTIKGMIEDGKVSDSILQTLCTQLYSLESAVKANGATSDVYNVLDDAENVVNNMGRTANVNSTANAYTAISVVRNSLDSVSVNNRTDNNASAPVSSAPITSFRDVQKGGEASWAYDAIMAMTSKGLFSGKEDYGDGSARFAPKDTMTRAEFVTVVVRYLYNDELKSMEGQGAYWYSNAYAIAKSHGLMGSANFSESSMSQSMTREEMAVVLACASSIKGTSTNNLVDSSVIPDYNKITSGYRSYVLQAYTQKLIAGTDSNGTFSPAGTLNRAQAATVLYRLVQKAENPVPNVPVKTELNDGHTTARETPLTLRWDDPTRPYAREGDIFIAPDGKEYKLTVDPKTGVVGYGLPIATDLGRVDQGETVKDKGYVTTLSRPGNSGNQYLVNPHTGEGHFVSQWNRISDKYYPTTKGTYDGELSADKNFEWSGIAGCWMLVV